MKKFINLMFVPVWTFFCSTQAFASDWRYLTSDKIGMVVAVDLSSLRELPAIEIKRPFPVRQIWVSMDFSRDPTVKYKQKRQLQRFNCNAETGIILSNVIYGADERVIESHSIEDYDFRYEPETPDTIGYAIMEFACGRRELP